MRLLIFVLFTTSIVKAQNLISYKLEVDYNIFYNTELKNTQKGVLYLDESLQKSLFIHGENTNKSISKDTNDDATFRIKTGGIKKFNYSNFLVDSLFSKNKIRKEFIINEKIPDFKWVLKNETKKLNELLLNKATLSFRGRNFTAWYCEKYPVKFGPWKFSGLPGLIIEIYDETKRYHWLVSSIKTNNNLNVIDIDKLSNDTEIIDIKEYVNRRYNNKGFINQAKLPRGHKIMRTKLKRNSIELKFEWEEKNNED